MPTLFKQTRCLGLALGALWVGVFGSAQANVALFNTHTSSISSSNTNIQRPAYRVELAAQALTQTQAQDEIVLNVPGQGEQTWVVDQVQNTASGDTLRVGHIKDFGEQYSVTLQSNAQGLRGHISTPEGEMNLVNVNGQTWLVAQNEQISTSVAADNTILDVQSAEVVEQAVLEAQLGQNEGVNVLVLVNQELLAQYGNQLSAHVEQLLLQSAPVQAGQKIAQLEINAIQYSETNSNNQALADLVAQVGPNIGQSQKDVVILLRPYDSAHHGNCQQAELHMDAQNPNLPLAAFLVLSDGNINANSLEQCNSAMNWMASAMGSPIVM